MIHSKRLKLCLCLMILSVFISACGMKKEESSKDKQIKENFNKTLSLYPTKNLEDFYDKEGFRDEEFEKGDKGTWIIHSKMIIETNNSNMESRGMVLYINRNTRTTKGNFVVREITEDSKGYSHNKDTKYPVKMEHNRIIPTNKAPKLLLKGDGDLKGSSVGSRSLEFTFVENKEENIFFTDSVQFTPSEGNES
ncbi:TPA: tandem-type lipoprotein [Staphylococcus aureus]|nr:tandem-type lipoprotein [Staphylococcus aureus]HCW7135886.1 tandem-type lipoprotein [Staphylococcus aureus]HCW7844804.1 tandem-type lipoprotein [Staphylococcus aureus]HCW7908306.1 tandem-type lipoprotein [Staphylococcus aureus]HCX0035906.1 tandem-type lipoprotein [Staphylococcus aureus]